MKATGTTPTKASHKPTIPDCFIQWKEKFLIYGDFCSNLPKAQEKVDELCSKSEAVRAKIDVSMGSYLLYMLVCKSKINGSTSWNFVYFYDFLVY